MYLCYYVLGTGIPFLWQERFSSDAANLLRVNIMQICGMFQTKVLPLCSGLQNYVQGNGIINWMSKIAVTCTVASSSFNAHSNVVVYILSKHCVSVGISGCCEIFTF
jgi:hypothetical protein